MALALSAPLAGGQAPAHAATPPPAPSLHASSRRPARPALRTGHPALATAPPARVPLPPASSYVLVDVRTGNVLAAYNEHLRLSPASLTKVLTALIGVRYLAPGAGVPGTPVSESAYPNLANMEIGVSWPLVNVLQAMLVYSANDAAYALAQRVSGSLASFSRVMQRAAVQMGMTDHPVLHDPAGLDGNIGFEGGNLMSARDLAIAGRALLRVPELAHIVTDRSVTFTDPTGLVHDLPSMNWWFLRAYPGAIGLKTGYTVQAGNCIMAAATRNGRTMLAVVMKGYNMQQTAMDLLNQGFATPVAKEPTADRLPAVRLPSPPAPTVNPLVARPGGTLAGAGRRAAGKERAGRAATTGRAAAAPRGGPAHAFGHGAREAAGAPAPARPAGGLGAVLGSWLGQFLLLVSGFGAAVALLELFKADRLQRHTGGSRPGPRPATVHLQSERALPDQPDDDRPGAGAPFPPERARQAQAARGGHL